MEKCNYRNNSKSFLLKHTFFDYIHPLRYKHFTQSPLETNTDYPQFLRLKEKKRKRFFKKYTRLHSFHKIACQGQIQILSVYKKL